MTSADAGDRGATSSLFLTAVTDVELRRGRPLDRPRTDAGNGLCEPRPAARTAARRHAAWRDFEDMGIDIFNHQEDARHLHCRGGCGHGFRSRQDRLRDAGPLLQVPEPGPARDTVVDDEELRTYVFPIRGEDFAGGTRFDGNRWNDCHYTNRAKQAAREAAKKGGTG